MTLVLQPTLTGPRLLLRPMVETDRDDLFQAASDPLIWAVHPAHDRWKLEVFRDYFDGGLASGGALVVIDRESGAIIGSSRYFDDDPSDDRLEIGWTFLSRSHWGGSYNRELKRLMLRHIFHYFQVVVFEVGESNWRSRRAMEKIGGLLSDRVDRRMMAGVEIVHVIYTIEKEAFFQSTLHLEAE